MHPELLARERRPPAPVSRSWVGAAGAAAAAGSAAAAAASAAEAAAAASGGGEAAANASAAACLPSTMAAAAAALRAQNLARQPQVTGQTSHHPGALVMLSPGHWELGTALTVMNRW